MNRIIKIMVTLHDHRHSCQHQPSYPSDSSHHRCLHGISLARLLKSSMMHTTLLTLLTQRASTPK